jgi:hypothetical protein
MRLCDGNRIAVPLRVRNADPGREKAPQCGAEAEPQCGSHVKRKGQAERNRGVRNADTSSRKGVCEWRDLSNRTVSFL